MQKCVGKPISKFHIGYGLGEMRRLRACACKGQMSSAFNTLKVLVCAYESGRASTAKTTASLPFSHVCNASINCNVVIAAINKAFCVQIAAYFALSKISQFAERLSVSGRVCSQ